LLDAQFKVNYIRHLNETKKLVDKKSKYKESKGKCLKASAITVTSHYSIIEVISDPGEPTFHSTS